MPKCVLFAGFLIALLFSFPESGDAASFRAPRILSRAEWGADESLGMAGATGELTYTEEERMQETKSTSGLSEREKECRDAVRNHPGDFAVSHTTTGDGNGESYRWERRYSKEVKLLVIHHTGELDTEERRHMTGPERVRAIYKMHTVGNGWGDVGYHFLIDDDGVLYEGRAGGHGVIGAHVYCANTGTIGVALIGNYQNRYPPEKQLMSLRWLLADLADEYGLDPNGRTVFHGRSMPTIVTHRDLAATQCAGRRVQMFVPKIRRFVAVRDFATALLSGVKEFVRTALLPKRSEEGISPIGSTTLRLPPNGVLRFRVNYGAGEETINAGKSIAEVTRSDPGIGLWQERFGSRIRVGSDVRVVEAVRSGESAILTLHVLAPRNTGSYALHIGDVRYELEVSGRRMRSGIIPE
jgi:hypothetical protein